MMVMVWGRGDEVGESACELLPHTLPSHPSSPRPPNPLLHTLPLQTGSAPVFLRGKSDRFVYRSAMIMSLCGIGITLYGVVMMATGQLKKKS